MTAYRFSFGFDEMDFNAFEKFDVERPLRLRLQNENVFHILGPSMLLPIYSTLNDYFSLNLRARHVYNLITPVPPLGTFSHPKFRRLVLFRKSREEGRMPIDRRWF